MWPSISTAVTQGLHLDTEHSLQRTHSIIFSFVLDSQTSECLTSKYSLTKASIASIDAAAELAGSISMMHAPRDHIAGPISQARARLRAAAERGQALYAATVSSQPNALPTSMITLSYPSNRLFLPDVEVLPGSWAEAMLQGYQFVKRSLSKVSGLAFVRRDYMLTADLHHYSTASTRS